MKRYIFQKTNSTVLLFICVLTLCAVLAFKLAFDNRIYLAGLSPTDTTVTTEQMDQDINTILNLYGLKKDTGEILHGEGDSIYDIHYKKDGLNGKSIFINVTPIFLQGSSSNYIEVENLMEIWLYINERNFNYDIDGITYYFTTPALKSMLAPLVPNEIYMSKSEFLSLYNELDIDKLPHHKKVKVLADKYVKKQGYQRKPGHVQVH